MNIEQNGETKASDAGEQALRQNGMVNGRCGNRCAPQPLGKRPCRGRPHRQSRRDQEHLNDPVDAGIGVAVDDVPHGVGEQQAGNEDHQSADGNGVWILCNAHSAEGIGQQRHQEGSGDGSEELVSVLRVQKPNYKSNQYPANTGAEAVQKIAAEQQPEAQCAQKIPQINDGNRIDKPLGAGDLHPPLGFLRLRRLTAIGATQAAEFFYRVQIVAVGSDAAHPGDGGAVLHHDGDDQVIGNGEHFRRDAVAAQHPADAFLHPERLRAAHGKLIAKIRGKIQ